MAILRTVAAVVVGYIVMVIGVFVTLTLAWMVLKAEGAFEEVPSWEPTMTWTLVSLVLGLLVAIVGGLVCTLIAARGSKAPVGLAVFILVMGGLSAAAQVTMSNANTSRPPRGTDISMFDAMQNTDVPILSMIGNPIVGVIGVLIGARLRGSKGDSDGVKPADS